MEKRRRERINHSLETLRLLMLENTHDEVRTRVSRFILVRFFWQSVPVFSLCDFFFFFFLETEESQGGEGRDSRECGSVPQD